MSNNDKLNNCKIQLIIQKISILYFLYQNKNFIVINNNAGNYFIRYQWTNSNISHEFIVIFMWIKIIIENLCLSIIINDE